MCQYNKEKLLNRIHSVWISQADLTGTYYREESKITVFKFVAEIILFMYNHK